MNPIIPIPPFFNEHENLNYKELNKYFEYLKNQGAETIMSTVGTSLFHLLDIEEIYSLNGRIFDEFGDNSILGLPPTTYANLEFFLYDSKSKPKYLILYPERYYDVKSIVDFYIGFVDKFNIDIWIHGHPLRSGHKLEWVDFPIEAIKELREHPNITGLKEESFTFNTAYEVSRLARKDFTVCVAGGSGRRFSLCKNVGAQTYLAGIGNIFPNLENELYDALSNLSEFHDADTNYLKIENGFFDIMKPWHPALRYAISCLDFDIGNRKPFPQIGIKTAYQIEHWVKKYIKE